jgi:hypothetical protein
MDYKELRVGNIIGQNLKEFPNNYFRVIEVADMNMKVSSNWNGSRTYDAYFFDCEIMEGIPLDESWFDHYGFGRSNDHWRGWLSSPLNDGSRLRIMDGLYYESGFSRAPVKYVHHLQNLWFVLTGKELKRSKNNGVSKAA